MPHALYQLFFSIHRYSIDIALGAAAVLFGLSQALLLPIPWYFYLLLTNGTFMVYWLDHIQDSSQTLLVQPGARHAIFKEKRNLFLVGIGVLAIVNMGLVYLFLSLKVLLAGALLVLVLLGYLRFHRQLRRVFVLEKEVLVSLLYTASTGFATVVCFRSPFVSDWLVLALLLLSVFCSTIQNLFSVARIEAQDDAALGIRNISHVFGSGRLKALQELFLLLQMLVFVAFLLLFQQLPLLICSGLLLFVAVLNYALPYFYPNAASPAYRWLGDGAFVLLFLCGL